MVEVTSTEVITIGIVALALIKLQWDTSRIYKRVNGENAKRMLAMIDEMHKEALDPKVCEHHRRG